ncbi:hypothetical protein B0H15DRAFT_988435 [Mycena belliarum]|uniref:Uncharacterized protein n=1 Tax=Mycena belliarum TaxID=1033014 RepID=A0AAD6U5F9_9AGAR|nr:hypothetical protein B0H15DRAFT_988435 [Mycena belliae]
MGNLAPTHWVTGSSSILGCELATTITTPASATLASELVSSRTDAVLGAVRSSIRRSGHVGAAIIGYVASTALFPFSDVELRSLTLRLCVPTSDSQTVPALMRCRHYTPFQHRIRSDDPGSCMGITIIVYVAATTLDDVDLAAQRLELSNVPLRLASPRPTAPPSLRLPLLDSPCIGSALGGSYMVGPIMPRCGSARPMLMHVLMRLDVELAAPAARASTENRRRPSAATLGQCIKTLPRTSYIPRASRDTLTDWGPREPRLRISDPIAAAAQLPPFPLTLFLLLLASPFARFAPRLALMRAPRRPVSASSPQSLQLLRIASEQRLRARLLRTTSSLHSP